jgi:hypothetical protein
LLNKFSYRLKKIFLKTLFKDPKTETYAPENAYGKPSVQNSSESSLWHLYIGAYFFCIQGEIDTGVNQQVVEKNLCSLRIFVLRKKFPSHDTVPLIR